MACKKLITAGATRQWRPRFEQVYREIRQFGLAVPGRVKQMGPRERLIYETGNWLVITD